MKPARMLKVMAGIGIFAAILPTGACSHPAPMSHEHWDQVAVCGDSLYQGVRPPALFSPHALPSDASPPSAPAGLGLPPAYHGSPSETASLPEMFMRLAPGCAHGATVRVVPVSSARTANVVRAPDGSVIALVLVYSGSPPVVYVYRNGKAAGEVTEPPVPEPSSEYRRIP